MPLPEWPVAMDAQLQQLLGLLECKKIVGNHGPGGVGKTALVNDAANHYKRTHRWDCCYVEVGAKMRIEDMQQQIADDLCGKQQLSGGPEQRRKQLTTWLRDRMGLLVLDDVWENLELQCLFIPSSSASKVIVTARKLRLLKVFFSATLDVDYHQLKPMPVAESLELICRHCFGVGEVPPGLASMVHQLADAGGGLPLAIISAAKYLSSSKSIQHAQQWQAVSETLQAGKCLDSSCSTNDFARLRAVIFRRCFWTLHVSC